MTSKAALVQNSWPSVSMSAWFYAHWVYNNQYCFVNAKKPVPGMRDSPMLIIEVLAKSEAAPEAPPVYALVPRTAYGATAAKLAGLRKKDR